MDRRAFLGVFGASMAALAIDPERLLWTPGQKSYHFISRPFAAGDVVCQLRGMTRWNLATARLVQEGARIGVWDGLRVVDNGPITAKIDFGADTLLFTPTSTWRHYGAA